MPPPSYSLSSATTADPSCKTKKKRVSAQLSRLMGSRSRSLSSDGSSSRRGVSEDGAATPSNNNMSKAAAWMWHTRGIGEAAVLPTKQCTRMVNASSTINARSSSNNEVAKAIMPEINTRTLQPSRFKAEANMQLGSAPADDGQLYTASSSAGPNYASHESDQASGTADGRTQEGKHQERRPTFLYDSLELSYLQELLQREIDKHSAQQQPVAHNIIQKPCTVSSCTTSNSSRLNIKPLSAIHNLFKKLYTIVHNRNTRNSAIDTASPSGFAGPSKVAGTVQHVIHHHHYHHYRSLDLPSPESQPVPVPMSHLHGIVRRRRAHSESCSEARRLDNVINELN